MLMIGCDFNTRFQQISMMDSQTGEIIERQLDHEGGEARRFYGTLAGPARIGMEATGHAHWFERMLAEQGHELWVGDAAQIRAGVVRKQKTDPRDAFHILKMLLENRFPRIWIPSPAERDLRQLLQHRVRLVRFQTSVMNQLHALAMGQGLCVRKKLWTVVGRSELDSLAFGPWANRPHSIVIDFSDQTPPCWRRVFPMLGVIEPDYPALNGDQNMGHYATFGSWGGGGNRSSPAQIAATYGSSAFDFQAVDAKKDVQAVRNELCAPGYAIAISAAAMNGISWRGLRFGWMPESTTSRTGITFCRWAGVIGSAIKQVCRRCPLSAGRSMAA